MSKQSPTRAELLSVMPEGYDKSGGHYTWLSRGADAEQIVARTIQAAKSLGFAKTPGSRGQGAEYMHPAGHRLTTEGRTTRQAGRARPVILITLTVGKMSAAMNRYSALRLSQTRGRLAAGQAATWNGKKVRIEDIDEDAGSALVTVYGDSAYYTKWVPLKDLRPTGAMASNRGRRIRRSRAFAAASGVTFPTIPGLKVVPDTDAGYSAEILENGKVVGVFQHRRDGRFDVEGVSSRKLADWLQANGGQLRNAANGQYRLSTRGRRTRRGGAETPSAAWFQMKGVKSPELAARAAELAAQGVNAVQLLRQALDRQAGGYTTLSHRFRGRAFAASNVSSIVDRLRWAAIAEDVQAARKLIGDLEDEVYYNEGELTSQDINILRKLAQQTLWKKKIPDSIDSLNTIANDWRGSTNHGRHSGRTFAAASNSMDSKVADLARRLSSHAQSGVEDMRDVVDFLTNAVQHDDEGDIDMALSTLSDWIKKAKPLASRLARATGNSFTASNRGRSSRSRARRPSTIKASSDLSEYYVTVPVGRLKTLLSKLKPKGIVEIQSTSSPAERRIVFSPYSDMSRQEIQQIVG